MGLTQETDAQYHARTEISNSMLGDIDPPYRYHARYVAAELVPRVSTTAMDEGAATHMLMLEPDQFKDRFAIKEKVDGRSKAGKEYNAVFAAENEGKTILTTEQLAKCEAMANAAFNHEAAAELLRKPGINEATVLFNYPAKGMANGMACRSRIDKIIPGDGAADGIIIDIKTAKSASPNGFQRAIINYNYHQQAMFYRDGLAACGEPGYEGAADWPFVWIVVESSAPYCVGVYTMDDEPAQRGRELHQQAISTLAACLKENHWPQYTNGIEILHLPPWAYTDYDATEVIT